MIKNLILLNYITIQSATLSIQHPRTHDDYNRNYHETIVGCLSTHIAFFHSHFYLIHFSSLNSTRHSSSCTFWRLLGTNFTSNPQAQFSLIEKLFFSFPLFSRMRWSFFSFHTSFPLFSFNSLYHFLPFHQTQKEKTSFISHFFHGDYNHDEHFNMKGTMMMMMTVVVIML